MKQQSFEFEVYGIISTNLYNILTPVFLFILLLFNLYLLILWRKNILQYIKVFLIIFLQRLQSYECDICPANEHT